MYETDLHSVNNKGHVTKQGTYNISRILNINGLEYLKAVNCSLSLL